MKQLISPENFNKSIEHALLSTHDYADSAKHIKGIIDNLSGGTLQIRHDGSAISFYGNCRGEVKYLKKSSHELYQLARKRYLMLLLQILNMASDAKARSTEQRNALINELKELILTYASGNLDIARIVLTSAQYKWYTSNYHKKKIDVSNAQVTANGLPTRSKSEKDIGNGLDDLAVIFHYEEANYIYVRDLVNQLEQNLIADGKLSGNLFHYKEGSCIWNVPGELQWMNIRGSIWRSYNYRSGKILIYNDFKVMPARGDIIIWEHEGLYDKFIYRCNANERIGIMRYTGNIAKENLITTYESEVATPEKIRNIIMKNILPRLWF